MRSDRVFQCLIDVRIVGKCPAIAAHHSEQGANPSGRGVVSHTRSTVSLKTKQEAKQTSKHIPGRRFHTDGLVAAKKPICGVI